LEDVTPNSLASSNQTGKDSKVGLSVTSYIKITPSTLL
jgi:hypothetical protein